jgi:hypothetical protein
MFVYGNFGRNTPYAIKILTQIQISKVLTNNLKNLKKQAVFIVLSFKKFADSSNQ